jgi:hypothetical protein
MFPQTANPLACRSLPFEPARRSKQFRPTLERLEERSMAGLVVTPLGNNPAALAQALVGPGVQIMNVTAQMNLQSAGTFTGGAGIIGFESGIILSSGHAADVVGPNKQVSSGADTSVDNGLPGDATLSGLVGGAQTFNASTLSFDFIPQGSVLTFSYVFASEEYNTFVGSQFDDVFGFVLNGQNVALVPGTNTPVSVNTVNLNTNSQFYINNDSINGPVNTEMNGLTTVLTVTAPVNPGVVNHIMLGVADTGDTLFDSNVFIESGSFSAPPPPPLEFKTYYPFRYIQDQQTGLLHGNLTLLNPLTQNSLPGPIQVIFPQLPAGVTLVNATGTTSDGFPFIDILPNGGQVSPGGVFRIELVISDPNNVPVSTFFVGPPITFAQG